MANKDYKNGKLVEIIREFNHTGATRYEINGINQAIAVPFWRIAENKFNVIPKGSYKFINESGNNYLEITDNTILEQATQFQICYVYSQMSSKYIEEFPELSVMVNKYNELVDDATKLFSYLKSVGMTSDTLQLTKVLSQLEPLTTWFMDNDGEIKALPISDLYSKFNLMIDNLKKILADYTESKKEEISGATYTPYVSPEGIITFTNDKNKPNPEPVNIKGPSGTIENVTASVNSNAGVPSVKVTMSGTKENRSFNLEFQNLKGDKPIKGEDYYTQQEKEQFTAETLKLVTDEGNKQISLTQAEALKVIEQLKKLVEGNPETSNAQTLSGKTRVEFEQDIENVETVVKNYVKQNETNSFEKIDVTIFEEKMLVDKGVITISKNKDVTVTDYFEVIPGESIFVTGKYSMLSKLIAFYDKDKKFVSQFPSEDISGTEVTYYKEFIVPLKARYAVVGNVYNYPMSLLKKEKISETLKIINNELEYNKYLSEHTFKIGNFINVTNNYEITKGYYLSKTNGDIIALEGATVTKFIDIDDLKDLYITANSKYQTTIFALYDANFKFLKSHSNDTELKEFNRKEIRKEEIKKLDLKAKYIKFSSYSIPLIIEKLNRKTTEMVYDDILKKIENSNIFNLGEYQEASYSLQNGYINLNGEFLSSSESYATDYIDINSFNELFINGNVRHSSCFYAIYDNSKFFIKSVGKNLGILKLEKISSSDILKENPTAKYIRVSTVYKKLEIYSRRRYTKDEIYERILETNVLYNKKLAVCGDSFTEGIFNFDGGEENPNLYDKANQSWKNWGWWIAHRNMMKFVNDGISGSTMALSKEYIDGTNPDINYRTPFSNGRYKKIPKDCDYILISFGLNENSTPIGTLQDTTNRTILGAWNIVLEYFLTNMPFAKIGIIIQDAWLSEGLTTAIKNVSEYWGIPYLELKTDPKVPLGIGGRNGINLNPKATQLRNKAFQISETDSHPNPKNHKYRSTFIENFIRSL